MEYTLYELLWLFLLYSFAGWWLEVIYAAVKKHTFINRGFVNSPLCPVYGTAAMAFALFLPELKEHIFFLFLGGMILAGFIEYITGKLMEKIFRRKLWDYSNERFHLEGYVCLKSLLVWGLCSVLMTLLLTPLLCRLVHMIPKIVGFPVLIVFFIILLLDIIGSVLAALHIQKEAKIIKKITKELHKTSVFLENAVTKRIQMRLVKAYPHIGPEKIAAEIEAKEKSQVFAEGCGFYKIVMLFMIGAFLGDIVETIFCYITSGDIMSRSSVVYGPFSIVWGLGCALLTAILYRYRQKDDRYIFLFGMILGGAYEYVCSVFTELVFGTVFWDYSEHAFNLGGRINLLYCFFWGVAAVVWMKGIYPLLSSAIEKIPIHIGKWLCHFMVIFMIINMLISSMALARYTQRQMGNEPKNQLEQLIDERFHDTRMKRIYPNAIIK